MNANNFPKTVFLADAYEPVAGSYSYITLQVSSQVTPTDKYLALTGVWAPQETIGGWLWDRRILENREVVKTLYDTYLGGHQVGLVEGTLKSDWQSGGLEGLGYLGVVDMPAKGLRSWTPQVRTGTYGQLWEHHKLHSDYSAQEYFDTGDDTNGVNVHEIRDDCLWSTLEIALYYREDDASITKYYDFEFVNEFTGVIDTGVSPWVRKTSVVVGVPQWADLDDKKHEFMILEAVLGAGAPYEVVLNQDWSIDVGVWTTGGAGTPSCPAEYVDAVYEDKGTGDPDGCYVYTRFLPVEPSSVTVIVRNGIALDTSWTEQATLNFSGPGDKHYEVDYDKGIITFGGRQAPDLILQTDPLIGGTEIDCYLDDESFAEYPDQGIIIIGTEYIKYERKTRHGFEVCTRGYAATVAAVHAIGSIVSHQQMGTGISDEIFIGYTAVPRIDYEITDHDVRTANRSKWVDVRPSNSNSGQDVLQIWKGDTNVSSLVLSTDKPLVGGSLYGPIYYGTDTSRITAKALDAQGNEVQGVSVTISITAGSGSLGGSSSHVAETNSKGETNVLYNAPYDKDSIEQQVTATTIVGADTTMVVPTVEDDVDADDIWVFQVLKHDQVMGSVGLVGDVDAWANTPGDANGESYIQVSEVVDDSYLGGWAYVGSANYTITKVYNPTVGSVAVSRIYLQAALPVGTLVGDETRLYQPDASEWTDYQDGVRVVLYYWDSGAQHPITGPGGAYMPVRPDGVSGTILTFDSKVLPVPDTGDNTKNLGAYVVVAPSRVNLQATVVDPISGLTVVSNLVRLDLTLPVFLVGVDSTGALEIPYGWKLVTPSYNIGAGVGGANFITINPEASGFNAFNITGTN